MKLSRIDIRPCHQPMRDANWKFARAALPRIEGHVLVLEDEAGHRGLGYIHAIPAISGPGAANRAATEWLVAPLSGQTLPDEPEGLGRFIDAQEARLAFNASAKAALDMALHDLLARRLGKPLHALLGTKKREAISQSRIVPLKAPADMAESALELAREGYAQVKLKLSGDTALDVERIGAVRDAVGKAVALTLDANQSYDAKAFLAAYERMQPFGIALVEQPVPAADVAGLAFLKRRIDAAVEADESAQSVDDVRRLIAEDAVDVVNLKVTKLGGLRRFLEAARLCASAGVACRLGAAFGPGLLQAFAAHVACVLGELPHACEMSEHLQLADDPFDPVPVRAGRIAVPAGVGCGVGFTGAPG